MSNVVIAEGLTKKYGDFTAVSGISFKVRERECFGFLGPNGAGKTSTMKIIQCIYPKTSGRVEIAGLSVDEHPREIKKILGVCPQEVNLDPEFTVYENLIIYSRYYDIPGDAAKKKALELLHLVQLEDKKDTIVERLSGGMKRRLQLARALINDPRLLVLDEPTVGLDPQARHLIWDKLTDLRRLGVTVLLTTHYMEEAEELCDRLVIMDQGKIIEEGSPKGLVRKYVGENVIETKTNPDALLCLEKKKEGLSFDVVGETIYVYSESPRETMEELFEACQIEKATIRRSTLEDVFLKLTGRALRE
jgi:lipooligosaccharide transport system ATP-binding protein